VGKLDINILDDSYVNIYDIPALNDVKTKNVFYNYLDENLFKFNMLIFFVDINFLIFSELTEIVNLS
jgi:hypothetical protein